LKSLALQNGALLAAISFFADSSLSSLVKEYQLLWLAFLLPSWLSFSEPLLVVVLPA
jgi:hypothetical protein